MSELFENDVVINKVETQIMDNNNKNNNGLLEPTLLIGGKGQQSTPQDSALFEPTTPEGPPPQNRGVFEPTTPEGPPLQNRGVFEPTIPEGPPPFLNENDVLEENDVIDKKQKQLDLIKQTYMDVTKRKINRQKNIYNPLIDTIKVTFPIYKVDKTIHVRIKKYLKYKLETKCNKHGLIKKDSLIIVSVSAGTVYGNKVEYIVTYQALACNPIEGMIVEANILNITKAGIRAELINNRESPMIIFISRDHHNNSNYFKTLKENSLINVKIIGVRYELNDTFVSVIGELYKF